MTALFMQLCENISEFPWQYEIAFLFILCYQLLSQYPFINSKTCYSVEHLHNEYEDPFILLYIDNLLLTEDQKTVKLADFGLAREESLTEMMTAETGTYRWMAPEVY